jgi:hypothetical protein
MCSWFWLVGRALVFGCTLIVGYDLFSRILVFFQARSLTRVDQIDQVLLFQSPDLVGIGF